MTVWKDDGLTSVETDLFEENGAYDGLSEEVEDLSCPSYLSQLPCSAFFLPTFSATFNSLLGRYVGDKVNKINYLVLDQVVFLSDYIHTSLPLTKTLPARSLGRGCEILHITTFLFSCMNESAVKPQDL